MGTTGADPGQAPPLQLPSPAPVLLKFFSCPGSCCSSWLSSSAQGPCQVPVPCQPLHAGGSSAHPCMPEGTSLLIPVCWRDGQRTLPVDPCLHMLSPRTVLCHRVTVSPCTRCPGRQRHSSGHWAGQHCPPQLGVLLVLKRIPRATRTPWLSCDTVCLSVCPPC